MIQNAPTSTDWGGLGSDWAGGSFPPLDWNTALTPEQKVQVAVVQLESQQQALEARLNAIKRMKEILTQKG